MTLLWMDFQIFAWTDLEDLKEDLEDLEEGGVFAMIRNELAPNLYFKNREINSLFEYLWFTCNDLSGKNKYFYCVIYHPPNPKYDVDLLVDQLLKDIEDIAMSNPAAIKSIIGDINHMDTTRFETDAGMSQLVQQATHGNNILDKFLTNQPAFYDICVFKSCIKTKHKAVGANFMKDFKPCSRAQCSQHGHLSRYQAAEHTVSKKYFGHV